MFSISTIRSALAAGTSDIPIVVDGRTVMTRLDVSDRQRRILLAGGILNLGKPQKVALTAIMRKLIELANTLVKADREWASKET